MREAGTCRAIAHGFNRRFAGKRRTTVGRTFVCELIRRHRYEIEIVARRIKNAKPGPTPQNLVWALNLTGKTTLDGRTQLIATSARVVVPEVVVVKRGLGVVPLSGKS